MKPFRWYGFINSLKDPNCSSYFKQYILKVREYYQKVGGTEIIYFPDQGSTQFIWNRYEDLNWEEIKKYTLNKEYYEEHATMDFSDNDYKKEIVENLKSKDKFLVVNIPETLRTKKWYQEEDILEILYDDMSEF